MANNSENKEIKELKEELNKSKKIIEQLNGKIKELENRLQNENIQYINKIRELENNINEKNNELNQLKVKLQNINSNNINSNFNNQSYKSNQDRDKSVTFLSSDQGICFSVPCSGNSTFAEVEELLYRQYPEYRETNNTFISEGKQILRFKTVNENNAGTGKPVMLIKPVED